MRESECYSGRHLAAHAVLDKTILSHLALLELNTEFDISKHNFLHCLLPCAMTLGCDHLMESVEGDILVSNSDKFCRGGFISAVVGSLWVRGYQEDQSVRKENQSPLARCKAFSGFAKLDLAKGGDSASLAR